MWYENLLNIKSKGESAPRPGSLAGLHETRKKTMSQFFTPDAVTSIVWSLLEAINPVCDRKTSLFDNSIGKGSMMFPAKPELHDVFGFDVDDSCVQQLSDSLDTAGFFHNIILGGFEEVACKGLADFALINPPFSLRLDSPTIEPFLCNTYGKYGPKSAAVSHHYAIDHALQYAVGVIAVLPTEFVTKLIDEGFDSFIAIYHLPINAFYEQGAVVKTSVCVLSRFHKPDNVIVEQVDTGGAPKVYPDAFNRHQFNTYLNFHLEPVGVSVDEPTITIPVTGDNRVNVAHNGRKILLKYHCGGTMAKVHNAILQEKAKASEKQKLPKCVRFKGQGVLDIELHLASDDPLNSFNGFLHKIKSSGGNPVVDKGIFGYLKNKIKKNARIMEPMGHTVFGNTALGPQKAIAMEDVLVDEKSLVSPVILKGQEIEMEMINGVYQYAEDGCDHPISEQKLAQSFELLGIQNDWHVRAEGKAAAFPELADMWRKKAKELRIHEWMSRDYQMDDLIESMIHPTGMVCGWEMGLGKTRYSLAVCLLSGVKHSLIVVKPKLIHEFMNQIKNDLAGYIDLNDINIIENEDDLTLKRFNFISTNRLRMLVNEKKSKNKTFARALRRRIGLAVVDEAHFISNFNTQQTKAVRDLSAKKLIVMSGTIMANYPRNLHPILNLIAGDGTATQPWGFRYPKLEPYLISNMNYAFTGTKAFADNFVTLEWCTHQYMDTGMIVGAKREIPRVKNAPEYREMLAPFVKRRVVEEPAVKKYFSIPKPNIINEFLDWDIEHLKFYYKIARDFASAWRQRHKDKNAMASILPRINAVIKASSTPFIHQKGFGCYAETTPKEFTTINYVKKWTAEGHQSIVYTNSPKHVVRLCSMLSEQGIKCIPSYGSISHKKRAEMLNENFKKGLSDCLVATVGTLSEGENLENASKVLFAAGREWSPKTEKQCSARVLRPKQIKDVDIVFLHYKGGIDSYMKQMIDGKQDCANAGLDYATPELDDSEFLHLDRILGQFVDELPDLIADYISDRAA